MQDNLNTQPNEADDPANDPEVKKFFRDLNAARRLWQSFGGAPNSPKGWMTHVGIHAQAQRLDDLQRLHAALCLPHPVVDPSTPEFYADLLDFLHEKPARWREWKAQGWEIEEWGDGQALSHKAFSRRACDGARGWCVYLPGPTLDDPMTAPGEVAAFDAMINRCHRARPGQTGPDQLILQFEHDIHIEGQHAYIAGGSYHLKVRFAPAAGGLVCCVAGEAVPVPLDMEPALLVDLHAQVARRNARKVRD